MIIKQFSLTNPAQQMFSFGGYSCEQDENCTPFFDDNVQETSIFTTDASLEFSAYELFNTNSQNQHSKFYEQESPKIFKQKLEGERKSSKKSLILELDEFNRSEAFDNLQMAYNQNMSKEIQPNQIKNSTKQGNWNENNANTLVQSVVKKVGQGEIPILNHNSNLAKSNFHKWSNINFNRGKQKGEGSNLKFKIDRSKFSFKNSMKSSKVFDKFEPISEQIRFNNERLSDEGIFDNNSHQNEQHFNFQTEHQQDGTKIPQNKLESPKKSTNQLQYPNKRTAENKPAQASSHIKGSIVGSASGALKFSNFSLRNSRALSSASQDKSNQIKQETIQTNTHNSSIKNENISNSNLEVPKISTSKPMFLLNLRKSEIKQKTEKNLTENTSNQSILQKNSNQQANKTAEKKFNFNVMAKIDEKKQEKENKTQQKKENFFGNQKIHPPKQKPYFNLKLIKEPAKLERNNDHVSKKQFNNLILEQKNKRENIQTAKFFKNTTNIKKFSFGNSDPSARKEQTEIKSQQNSKQTPKIMKVQMKNDQNLKRDNRQTEKFFPNLNTTQISEVSLKEESGYHSDEAETIKKHKIDYEKYQDCLNDLNEEVETARRKYLRSQSGYRNLFLLISKANLMLSNRFMSQTQTNEVREKSV